MALAGGGSRRTKAYRQSKTLNKKVDVAAARAINRMYAGSGTGTAKKFAEKLRRVRDDIAQKDCSFARRGIENLDAYARTALKGKMRIAAERIVSRLDTEYGRKCEIDDDFDLDDFEF